VGKPEIQENSVQEKFKKILETHSHYCYLTNATLKFITRTRWENWEDAMENFLEFLIIDRQRLIKELTREKTNAKTLLEKMPSRKNTCDTCGKKNTCRMYNYAVKEKIDKVWACEEHEEACAEWEEE